MNEYSPDEICQKCGVVRPCFAHDEGALLGELAGQRFLDSLPPPAADAGRSRPENVLSSPMAGAELRRYRGWITLPVDERTPAHPESEVVEVCRADVATAIIASLTDERESILGRLEQVKAIISDRTLGTMDMYKRLASLLAASEGEQ